jgi:hypothetical protein
MDRPATRSEAAVGAETWLAAFQDALTARDIDGAAAMFAPTSFWRDLVAFTWNITTVEGPDGVAEMLRARLDDTDPTDLRAVEEPTETDGVTDVWLEFETAVGRGSGHLRLQNGKAFTLLTTLDELKGFEEPMSARRPRGVEHGVHPNRKNFPERRAEEVESFGRTTQPYVLVVGGGQGGIALGARLRSIGVPALIVERNERPGDSWRKRYKHLALHDPVWYDHLPYLPFPKNWPVFSPKDKIADWLEMYTRVMEVNYWAPPPARRPPSTPRPRSGRSWSSGRRRTAAPRRSPCGRSSSSSRSASPASRTSRPSPARRCSAATSTTARSTRGRTPTSADGPSSSARTTPPTTSAPRSGRPGPTSRWCSAVRRTSSGPTR